jgi:hypothetical protein
LQLADIARPLIRTERKHRFFRNVLNSLIHPPAKHFCKMVYQGRYVFVSLPQRRQHNREHIQPVVEIAAKFAAARHPGQVTVRRSHQPNVHLVSLCTAQAFELLFLKDTQEFRLQRRRNVAYLVQEERTFIS